MEYSRRELLQVGAGIVIADALAPGAARSDGPSMNGKTASPDDALHALLDGNRRFVEGRMLAPHRSLARVKALADRQQPFAGVLACADSRVPVEVVFDQGLGDLFVVRVAGSVATPEAIGSLEYGAAVLGAQLVVVLGHTACGAVKAALAGEPVPGRIGTLFPYILPALDPAHHDLAAAIAANVRHQARVLSDSPVLAGLVHDGRLKIVGAVYDLATGEVTPLAG